MSRPRNQPAMLTFGLGLGAALAMAGGCKSESASSADRAAHHLVELADHHADGDVSRAADVFAVRRQARVDRLRGEEAVAATQASVIRKLAAALPLTDIGRSDVGEKVTVFELRLDDAAHAISALVAVPAADFAVRDDGVTKAMTRLEDARKAAWSALDNAPRIDRSASL